MKEMLIKDKLAILRSLEVLNSYKPEINNSSKSESEKILINVSIYNEVNELLKEWQLVSALLYEQEKCSELPEEGFQYSNSSKESCRDKNGYVKTLDSILLSTTEPTPLFSLDFDKPLEQVLNDEFTKADNETDEISLGSNQLQSYKVDHTNASTEESIRDIPEQVSKSLDGNRCIICNEATEPISPIQDQTSTDNLNAPETSSNRNFGKYVNDKGQDEGANSATKIKSKRNKVC